MQKLVVLKLDGDLGQGVRVTLEIGAEGARPTLEVRGYLPPQPEIIADYKLWQTTYRSLQNFRITPVSISVGNSLIEHLDNCRKLEDKLSKRINSWLHCESFRASKEKLLKQLMTDDTVRILIKTDDIWLRRLPWQLWNFFEEYSKAEVALSALEYEYLPASKIIIDKYQVKILAILGNSQGIFIDKDREILEKLPNAEINFLVEPQRNQINDKLWEQDWDILFFAGHSFSQQDGKVGKIYINETDCLTIQELKYALKEAVSRGLQLAIFNSCDGLGLAHQLEDLHIPQIIVMREPVHDLVAQEFLKNFLDKFASGESLYLAVRESREKLHGIADKYPSAIIWLPVVCQNPAAIPPTWKDLLKKSELKTRQFQLNKSKIRPHSKPLSLQKLLLLSLAIAALVMGVRRLGMLQTWELQALEHLMQLRPPEKQDKRILVITVNEEDFQLKEQQQRKGSLSDLALMQLLEKLDSYHPQAIGLDIYRDFPVGANYSNLATRLRNSDRFYGICEVSEGEQKPGIAPPPEISLQRQGFSDFVVDSDYVIRRHLIAIEPSSTSPCATPYALSARLAFHYLQSQGINVNYTQQGDLQVGKIIFKQLRSHMGGYQQIDDRGYQVLLNYRSSPFLTQVAEQVSLKDVLTGKVNSSLIKNRIILIGVGASSAGDIFLTPFSEMPGVIIHAQMVSQILSAVLDGRPLLQALPFWNEVVWVLSWSFVGGTIARCLQTIVPWGLTTGAALMSLYGLSYYLLIQGYWIPLVPSVLVLGMTGASVVVFRLQQINSTVITL
ncbi:MAG: CHASE2 domain-containing protein [Nostoc sp. ChiQUE01a]|nr:CHASE2 domain-containing protein [Nostoc sp. ChiQUE01a]